MDLRGRSLLKEIDFTAEEFLYLVDLGGRLRADKRAGRRARRLVGRAGPSPTSARRTPSSGARSP